MSTVGQSVVRISVLAAIPTAIAIANSCSDPTGPIDEWLDCRFEIRTPYTVPGEYPGPRGIVFMGDTARLALTGLYGWDGTPRDGPLPILTAGPVGVLEMETGGLLRAVGPGLGWVSAGAPCVSSDVREDVAVLEVLSRPAAIDAFPDSIELIPGNGVALGVRVHDADGAVITPQTAPYFLWSFVSASIIGEPTVDYYVNSYDATTMLLQLARIPEGDLRVVTRIFDVADTTSIAAIAVDLQSPTADASRSCALDDQGSLLCWGGDLYKVVGNTPYVPGATRGGLTRERSGQRFGAIDAADESGCGVTLTGTVYCWGNNEVGQLGTGTNATVDGPQAVLLDELVTSLATGYTHTCAITASGQTVCWGSNPSNELGAATTDTCSVYRVKAAALEVPCSRTAVAVTDAPTFASIHAGRGQTCGLTEDGALYCWGWGYGAAPVPVATDHVWSMVTLGGSGFGSADGDHVICGIDANGVAYCWGTLANGLGDGHTTDSADPVAVAGDLTFTDLDAGRAVCGVTNVGTVYCWGGTSEPFGTASPTLVPGSVSFASVSVGSGDHACGFSTDGDAYCWGSNNDGELGVPWIDVGSSEAPVKVEGQR